jgi:hypothetical protein
VIGILSLGLLATMVCLALQVVASVLAARYFAHVAKRPPGPTTVGYLWIEAHRDRAGRAGEYAHRDVRLWHFSEVPVSERDVCLSGKTGSNRWRLKTTRLTQSGHLPTA